MKALRTSFISLAVVALLGISTSRAQETEEPQDFGARIDSVVQNIFQRIDSRLGTYIFMDEPAPLADMPDALEEFDHGFASYESHEEDRSRFRHRRWRGWESSLYSFEPNRGIMRNPTANYPWEKTNEDFLF